MPRKKAEPATEVQQPIGTGVIPMPTADELIAEHFRNDDWLAAESKRFAEHTKPIVDRNEAIKNLILEKLNAEGQDSFKTEHGTAYKSRILNTKIDADAEPYTTASGTSRGREALLDFCLDMWDEIGNELLIVNAQKDAVKAWIEKTGKPPPGISTSTFVRINIRRS